MEEESNLTHGNLDSGVDSQKVLDRVRLSSEYDILVDDIMCQSQDNPVVVDGRLSYCYRFLRYVILNLMHYESSSTENWKFVVNIMF